MLHFCANPSLLQRLNYSGINSCREHLLLRRFYNKKISCLQRKLYDKLTYYVLTI